jgi:glutamate dehydrogenase
MVLDVFRFSEDEAAPELPASIAMHFDALEGDADTLVSVSPAGDSKCHVLLVAGGVPARRLLDRGAGYLARREVPIRGAHMYSVGSSTAVSFVLGLPAEPLGKAPVTNDLRRLAWADERAYVLSTQPNESVSLVHAEIWVALLDLTFHALSARDPHRYSRGRIFRLGLKSKPLLEDVASAVIGRCTLSEAKVAAVSSRLDGDAIEVLNTIVQAAEAVQHHNLQEPGRYGVALRLDPGFLHAGARSDKVVPHATVFFAVDGGMGFHVRFRDIARGGLRVVRPRTPDAYVRETERLYDECWGLAYAQQLKNKDIPEGGSKGVMLSVPGADVGRLVKAVGDGIIDLCLSSEPGSLADRIFLGPDENITDELIVWLVDRAKTRGYPVPNAFMSSKPGAGVNHKQYGVTSEGVVVFFEEAMRAVGRDPRREPVSVILTGGPDGDVAGNAIKILSREYGDNVRIVGIADGTGVAEEPEGLSRIELLRLVDEGLGIAHFDPERLSADGCVLSLSDDGGVTARNSLPFRLSADALLPCGGRPATIHEGNWRDLLDGDGTPKVRAIVEGANLFVTSGARRLLDVESGVVVVKDSSANKCGVICSSFEIAAAHLVDAPTFLEIKEQFVEQVLHRLRELARREARLLFRTRTQRRDLPLVDISVLVSRTINRVSDAVETTLTNGIDSDLQTIIDEYFPKALRKAVGSIQATSLPRAYLARTVATALAGDLVYREGLSYVEGLTDTGLSELATSYLRERTRVRNYADAVLASDLDDKQRIAELLLQGGVRAAVEG